MALANADEWAGEGEIRKKMNYWKLGCRWTSKAPLFFNYLLDNKIVISWSDKKFNINDIVLLTDGFTAIGIANGDDVQEAFDTLQSYAESKSK